MKVHKCVFCGAKFREVEQMAVHMSKRHGEKLAASSSSTSSSTTSIINHNSPNSSSTTTTTSAVNCNPNITASSVNKGHLSAGGTLL